MKRLFILSVCGFSLSYAEDFLEDLLQPELQFVQTINMTRYATLFYNPRITLFANDEKSSSECGSVYFTTCFS